MRDRYLTRFAPSPTGYLHTGHAYAAARAFGQAAQHGGVCLLRIEDIDQTRCRPEYEAAVREDLAWLGFDWLEPVRRQSDHFGEYEAALARLVEMGLVYRCFLTRRELAADLDRRNIGVSPAGERPYPGPTEPLSAAQEADWLGEGRAFAWRLSLERCRAHLGAEWAGLGFEETGDAPDMAKGCVEARPDWLGDVVLARKDTPTSYHLAVCHDDALQGISHVVRGADLFHATHIHVLIQTLLGWETPRYFHHGLILDATGRKFSKTDRSKTLRSLRAEGVSAERLLKELKV